MKTFKIVSWPNEILKTPCEPVTVFDRELSDLVQKMHRTMIKERGIGLAANQVGVSKRIVIINVPRGIDEEQSELMNKSWVFINPVITRSEGETSIEEGCLSWRGEQVRVPRAAEVWVTAQDENSREFSVHAKGLFAICLQHEIDHLNGIFFLVRALQP